MGKETDDPPGLDPVIPFRVSDRLRIGRLEVKMNVIQYLAGASVVGIVSVAVILLTGVRAG